MSSKNRPFNNASNYDCWMYQNCFSCSKAGDVAILGSSTCEIFKAIHDAFAEIYIPEEVEMRFGEVESKDFLSFRDWQELAIAQQPEALP